MSDVFDALAALVKALTALTGAGGELEGVQVAYAMLPAKLTPLAIYGGRVRFTRSDDTAVDGDDELTAEAGTADLYVRVKLPLTDAPNGIVDSDRRARQLGAVVENTIAKNRRMAGPHTYMRIAGGDRDYTYDDDSVTSSLLYSIAVDSYLD